LESQFEGHFCVKRIDETVPGALIASEDRLTRYRVAMSKKKGPRRKVVENWVFSSPDRGHHYAIGRILGLI
jgi:hypothetical protein